MARFLIGVDEAGRGPLAGPVAVGVVAAPASFAFEEMFPGLGDSKTLSEKKRDELYATLVYWSRLGALRFCVRFAAPSTIDKVGISMAVRRGVWNGVRSLAPEPGGFRVLLDGLLAAPPEYEQQTIVRGDASEPVISLAAIAAKVRRDRLMCLLAKRYPKWGFERHKGYGTAAHCAAIRRHGLCPLHRRTFRFAEK